MILFDPVVHVLALLDFDWPRCLGGVDTLSNRGRERLAPHPISSCVDGASPRFDRCGAERSVRLPGCEMALDVEGVAHGGVNGKKRLGRAWTLEALHLALSSSRWLIRVLGTIVFPAAAFKATINSKLTGCGAIRPQIISDQSIGCEAVFL